MFATKVARYWFWLPTKCAFTWHGMPWTNTLGWALGLLVAGLAVLAAATGFCSGCRIYRLVARARGVELCETCAPATFERGSPAIARRL